MGDEELVALAKAAGEIGRSREWLRLKVRAGEVRATMIGRVIGIPHTEVRRLKAELKGKPKARGHWPKGKPRKPTVYPEVGEHGGGRMLQRAAEPSVEYRA